MHKPIYIQDLELSFSETTCFASFSTKIHYGNRIAIIGRNGSGKTTLLKMIQAEFAATSGSIAVPADVTFGYVPQVVEQFDSLSGGQRFNRALTAALALDPNVLLLDEPSNHLDLRNR
jgi:ATPase subunit of ABC transporter with duplicated ATPase domains